MAELMKKYILLIIITLLASFIFQHRDFFAIDECLDAGGSWNDATRKCVHGQ